MTKRERALLIAELFAVFPLQPGKKIPLKGSKGFQDASNNPEVIKKWWDDNPHLNIGVYPGERYVIFDFEGPEKGNDPIQSLKLFQRKTGFSIDLTDHMVVSTPSGGFHVYMKVNPDSERVYTSTTNFVQGCDIRAHGGYVLGSGSIVDGKTYATQCNKLPKYLPEAVAKTLPTRQQRASDTSADEDLDLPHCVKRATAFLDTTDPAIEGFGGDDWTFKTACKVRGFGISESMCLELMNKHWNPRCEPPWDYDDLIIKVENAYEYALEKAGIDGGDPNEAFASLVVDDEQHEEDEEPEPAPTFNLLSKADVANWPKPRWIIKKTIPQRGLGFVIGPYASYKTYLCIDLTASIACGIDFASRAFKQGGLVLYCAGEGPYGVKLRFEAWFKEHELDWPDNLYLCSRLPNFGDPEDVKRFAQEIKALGIPVAILVIDTISMASLGADENSAKDMGLVLQGMQHLRDCLDCFVLGVHHMGKDQSKGSRGWSGLPAAADVEIQVTGDVSKREAYVRLTKSRDSETWPEKEVFKGKSVPMGKDDDGEEQKNLAFFHDPQAKAPKGDSIPFAKRRRAFIDCMREGDPECSGKKIKQAMIIEDMTPKILAEEDMLDPHRVASCEKGTESWLKRSWAPKEGDKWLLARSGNQPYVWCRPKFDLEDEKNEQAPVDAPIEDPDDPDYVPF